MATPMQYVIEYAGLTHKILRRADAHLSLHGISFSEYLIMHTLNAAPQSTLRRIEVADAIGITTSGVTRLLAPMEKIKLVEKQANPRDARVSLVKLSTVGKKLFKDASITFAETASDLTDGLSAKQLDQLLSLTTRLTKA